MSNANTHPYKDIIDLPHHVSPIRPQMSMVNRAAQFSPFAALTGYDAAIKETGRLTDERIDLSDDARMVLDRKQQVLLEHLDERPELSITYFSPDERKSGGAYMTITSRVKKIDEYHRLLVLTDGTKISIDEIFDMESELFSGLR